MQRHAISPRAHWQRRVEDLGFLWHTAGGEAYWSEDAYYSFTEAEVDRIAQACEELHRMFRAAGEHIVATRRFGEFGIPDAYVPLILRAWADQPPALDYGRFDLGIGQDGAIKLFEFNCDTPTSLVEASVVQWFWKEDVFPGLDQFNRIHEALVERWQAIAPRLPGGHAHFAHVPDQAGEDTLTTAYMMDIAGEAGVAATRLTMREIGWRSGPGAGFVDMDEKPIMAIWKLYPWEWLAAEPFGRHIAEDPAGTVWLEPVWKMLWSNKAILPVLWELFPDHPLLLWAGTQPPAAGDWVRKPRLGREGANVVIMQNGAPLDASGGPYDGDAIYQAFLDLPGFGGAYPVIGAWVVAGEAVGMGVREGGRITTNRSRFTPHVIKG